MWNGKKERSVKMKMSDKRLFAEILNALAREGELVVSDPETEELLSGEDIRTVCMKGDVIHICLFKSISERRAKKKKRKTRKGENNGTTFTNVNSS